MILPLSDFHEVSRAAGPKGQTPKTPNQTLGAGSKRPQTLVLITALRVAGEQQLISALGETAVRWPDLTASQNHLQIDFVGLTFAPGEALRYQYKLEETDADWSAHIENPKLLV